MAVEIVRLVRSGARAPRLSVASLDAILSDRRTAAIERSIADAPSEAPFVRVFVAHLVPFALSSKLWATPSPVVPSSLHDASRCPPGLPRLATLSANLAAAHRRLRRTARRTIRAAVIDDVQRTLVTATFRPELGGARRSGEMTFRCASTGYLMPSASDIPRYLNRFASAWNGMRSMFPNAGPLVAALCLALAHPFSDGNGRTMRAFAAAFGRGDVISLCNSIACFMQGRQRLWNFALPLALDGDRDALWRHIEISLEKARELHGAVTQTALRYRDSLGLVDADVRRPCDAALVWSNALDDRSFRFLAARASSRTVTAMRGVYVAAASADGAMQWINSGANALADGLTGPLMRHI